jgi:hypothetical protein
MAEAVTARRRGSMVEAARSHADEAPPPGMRGPDGAVVDWFRLRVAAQQFMNDNGPLFTAFAKEADNPGHIFEQGGLASAIDAATALATEVARRFAGTKEPSSAQIRPFRHAAADIVAHLWASGLAGRIDTAAIADQHAAAFQMVDEDLDRGLFQEVKFSDESSLAMTASAITFALMRPVMVYDFRRDRSSTVAALATAVMSMAAEAVAQMVPPDARKDERRSLLQTSANRLGDIMAAVYERKSRQVVAHIGALPESEKEGFCRRYDPIPDITKTFKEWGVVFAATSLAVARSAATASKDAPSAPRA